MLGLPSTTEVKRLIPKKKILERFAAEMSPERKKSFDDEIARITLYNEISPRSMNIADGNEIHSVFAVSVQLKNEDFDKQNISFIARAFGQNLVIVLNYEGKERLAIWQTKLIMNEWKPEGEYSLASAALNMDALWEGFVTLIGSIHVNEGNTLNQQIAINDKREKLLREIARLERQAHNEKQPKKKLELMQETKRKKAELEAL